MVGKSNSLILFLFGAGTLFFSACGNPIIKEMMDQPSDEIPPGTFHTSDLSGLPGYINDKRSIHPSKYDPIPVKILGGDYDELKDTLQSKTDITNSSYLSLDMSGMDGGSVPSNYFDGNFSSSSNCRIVSLKLSPSVTAIDDNAFYGNQYLVSVSMPGVARIDEDAFTNVHFLREIYMPRDPPSMPADSPFDGILISPDDDFIVYVPVGAETGEGKDGYYEWAQDYLLDGGNNNFIVRFRRYK